MTTVLPDYPILVLRVLLSALILSLYLYDLVHVFAKWRSGLDRRKGSDLRALVKSVNLCIGLVIILIGAVTAAFFSDNPVIRDVLRWLGYVLLGTLLVGGIALVTSWIEEKRLYPKDRRVS